jgi:hypothetical protein
MRRAWTDGLPGVPGSAGAGAREIGPRARRPVPQRHWRSYGDDKLPTGADALDEPFSAFPSWFMRITCVRCGKDRMLNEAHAAQRDLPIRTILDRMRHDGCGGRAGRVELLTGIEGASSRPVRRIVLIER